MSNEDTTQVEFYAVWPNLGKKFSQQLGEIRTDTAHLSPLVRGMGLDTDGDFSTLEGIEKNSIQSREWGKQGFHNKFRMHYNKTDDLIDFAYNTGTEEVPNWYTTWTLSKDGFVTQQNTPTTASNLGGAADEGIFFQKTGVDLEFKSLHVFYPLSVSSTGSVINFRTGAEANTYSSVTPSVPSGGTGGIESILADTGKVGIDFPFKAFEAGANAVITDTGNTIRFESTAQVVEFYGISIRHADDSTVYTEVHNLKLNAQQFYLTQEKTNPSNKTVILNFRGETLSASDFVKVAGDTMTGQLKMHQGTLALPSIGFSLDNDTGMRLRAINDLAFTVGGTDRIRVQDDLLLTAVPMQITNAGTVAAPDYSFFPDIDTGIFQSTIDGNVLSFATGGIQVAELSAGGFDTGRVTAGVGEFYVQVLGHTGNIPARPSYSFIGDPDTGMYRGGTNQIFFSTNGTEAVEISSGQHLRFSDGTALLPGLAFKDNTGVGLYRNATNSMAFITNKLLAAHFDASQNFIMASGNIIKIPVGTNAAPAIAFTAETGTGIYQNVSADGSLAFSSRGTRVGYFDVFGDFFATTKFVTAFGSASSTSYGFNSPRAGVGMYSSAADVLDFSTNDIRAMSISSTQIVTIFGDLQVEDGSGSAPSYSFTSDPDTGMYRAADGSLLFSTNGVKAGMFDDSQDFYVTNQVFVKDAAYDAVSWDGNFSVPTKNSLVDFLSDVAGGDGSSWTSRTSTADNSWRSVTYGNGLFVAVSFTGTGDRIMTSPDGINWTARTNPVDNDWRSVTYGNGLFVAVASTGTNDRVMTSPDGITWTIRTSAADNNWLSVTYGSGLFVAISTTGSNNRVMTSPDGINWTIRTSAANNAWRSVIYGNGLFVSVTSEEVGGDRVMTSPDGITWTSRTHSVSNNWFSVVYGNGLFVAVSNTGTGDRVMTSPDGITWTTRTSSVDNNWIGLTYGNGLFVGVSTDGTGDRVMTSPDGITWTTRTSAVDNNWVGVVYGNGMFVAVAQTGTGDRVMTSGKTELTEVSADNIYQGNLEVRNDLVVVGDVVSSRVEAGLGVFYASLTVEDFIDVTGTGTFTGTIRAEAFYLGKHNSGISTNAAGDMVIDSGPNLMRFQTFNGNLVFNTVSGSSPGDMFFQSGASVDLTTANSGLMTITSAGFLDLTSSSQLDIESTGSSVRIRASTDVIITEHILGSQTPGESSPMYSFTGDTDTGMYRVGTNSLGFATGGTQAGLFDSGQDFHVTNEILAPRVTAGRGLFYEQLLVGGGSKDAPGIAFAKHGETGIEFQTNSSTDHPVRVIADNNVILTMNKNAVTFGKAARLRAGSTTSFPAVSFQQDSNTGLYQLSDGDNTLGFTTDGIYAGHFDPFQNFYVANSVYVKDVIEADKGQFYTSLHLNDSTMKFASDGILYAWDPTRLKFLSVSRTLIQYGVNSSNGTTTNLVLTPMGSAIDGSGQVPAPFPRPVTITAITLGAHDVETADLVYRFGSLAVGDTSQNWNIDDGTGGTYSLPFLGDDTTTMKTFDGLNIDLDKDEGLAVATLVSGGVTYFDPVCMVEIAYRLD